MVTANGAPTAPQRNITNDRPMIQELVGTRASTARLASVGVAGRATTQAQQAEPGGEFIVIGTAIVFGLAPLGREGQAPQSRHDA